MSYLLSCIHSQLAFYICSWLASIICIFGHSWPLTFLHNWLQIFSSSSWHHVFVSTWPQIFSPQFTSNICSHCKSQLASNICSHCESQLASAIVALPPLHPVLLHTLFWPSLALSLSYPVTRISNPEGERLVTKSKGNESHPAASLLCKLCQSRLRSLPPRPVLLLVLLPPAQSSPCSTTPWRRR